MKNVEYSRGLSMYRFRFSPTRSVMCP